MNRQRHLHALTQRTTTRQRNLSAHTAMYHERHLSALAQIVAPRQRQVNALTTENHQ